MLTSFDFFQNLILSCIIAIVFSVRHFINKYKIYKITSGKKLNLITSALYALMMTFIVAFISLTLVCLLFGIAYKI